MMNKKYLATIAMVLAMPWIQAQTNGLSSSPYSLYGLGIQNEWNTGKANTMGFTGIALPSSTFINNYNPASYGGILNNRFLMDVGLRTQNETLFEGDVSEKRFNSNFSSVSFAFPLTKNSGFGFGLIPYTNVGYQVFGIETQIDGSPNTFTSNINGSGGINDLNINYGYTLGKRVRIGVKGSFLFGKIEENEIDVIGENVLSIAKESYYNGFRLGLGLQLDVNEKLKLGGIANLPTHLNGDQTSTLFVFGAEPTIDENNLDQFKLPLELGIGANYRLSNRFMVNLDYRKNFWSETQQTDLTGTFVDQEILGFGAEYTRNPIGLEYWDRVNYRFGVNIDQGNLEINGARVNKRSLGIGIGLPIRSGRSTMINIGYTYGQKGQISGGLIKENFHSLSVNFSLEGLWFLKRYYD